MRLTNDILDSRLVDRNIARLDSYVNSQTPMKFKCLVCGNEWGAKWNNISNGKGCPPCSFKRRGVQKRCDFDMIKSHAISMGGMLLSSGDEYQSDRTMLLWQCKEGHRWEACWNNVNPSRRVSTWCPRCGRTKVGDLTRLSFDAIKSFVEAAGGHLLTDRYTNSGEKMAVECAKGHIFSMKWDHIKAGHWCPRCTCGNHESKQEVELREYLKSFYPDIRKEQGGDAIPGRKYEFDIFEPNLKKVIEFDGYWHTVRPDMDAEKDDAIRAMGYEILRVKASSYEKNPIATRLACLEFLAKPPAD